MIIKQVLISSGFMLLSWSISGMNTSSTPDTVSSVEAMTLQKTATPSSKKRDLCTTAEPRTRLILNIVFSSRTPPQAPNTASRDPYHD